MCRSVRAVKIWNMDSSVPEYGLPGFSLDRFDPLKSLDEAIFEAPTVEVARRILGAFLMRRLPDGRILSGPIVEVEAYTEDDPACHAYRGLTARTEVMFGPPARAYVYFIYGMYHCLNVVTEADGSAGAVLIRAVGADGTDGPGKLCREWSIDRSHNGVDLLDPGAEIWLARGMEIDDAAVDVTPRIGLSVAVERLWRFAVSGHPSVSGPRKVVARARKKRRKRDKGDSVGENSGSNREARRTTGKPGRSGGRK